MAGGGERGRGDVTWLIDRPEVVRGGTFPGPGGGGAGLQGMLGGHAVLPVALEVLRRRTFPWPSSTR